MLFDKPTYDKLLKEVPSYKLITPSVVSERLKITGSLARRALDELQTKGWCLQCLEMVVVWDLEGQKSSKVIQGRIRCIITERERVNKSL